MAVLEMKANDFDKLVTAMQEFGDKAEDVINQYLHNQGAKMIKENIQPLLPVSGRTWKDKKAPASSVDPFTQTDGNLSVKIHTRPIYHYLYFPDDGSNTIRHFGNQEFMLRGGEASRDEIAENIINKLLEKF